MLNRNKPFFSEIRRGFTLIELLVVIAIIALLAAILFPVFARARENARKSSCSNNMKQIGISMLQYVQDFDEVYPPTNDGGAQFMPFLYVPYIKSAQVFKCPSQSTANIGGSYGFNNNISKRAQADIPETSKLVVSMDVYFGGGGNKSPATTMTINGVVTPTYGLADDYTIWNGSGRVAGGNGMPRHLGANNMLYADGHVKTSPPLPSSNVNLTGAAGTLEGALPFQTYMVANLPSPGQAGPWN